MKTRNQIINKPYDFGEKMHFKMFDSYGKVGAVLGGIFTGVWNLFKDTAHLVPGEITLPIVAGVLLFLLKFAAGSVAGGVLGKVGGDLYTFSKSKMKNYLIKRKNKNHGRN